jgi:uncharacterized protein
MDTCRETEALTVTECWQRLASVPVGRVAFTEGPLPAVHPVNFLVHGGSVIIRTGPGAKLDAARRGDVLAFEADHIDPETRTGWSVLVVGHAAVVNDIDRLIAVLDPQHRPWVHGRGVHVIELAGERVTGRRLVLDRIPAA